ncbi:hypothetical protein AHAS_Ahas05G0280100 [Arachis hypogaea]
MLTPLEILKERKFYVLVKNVATSFGIKESPFIEIKYALDLSRRWVNHGESVIGMDVDTGDTGEIYSCDDIEGLLDEKFRNVADVEGEKEGMNEDAKKFYNLVDEASKEIYPDCKKFSTLSFTTWMEQCLVHFPLGVVERGYS